mmetsp:Transcript_7115/g.10557  ORF Transcript_7115/g.10557 Transcript_7115/m.10557 type:complete len:86 (-) Transcript_7115:298-555(-)
MLRIHQQSGSRITDLSAAEKLVGRPVLSGNASASELSAAGPSRAWRADVGSQEPAERSSRTGGCVGVKFGTMVDTEDAVFGCVCR